MLLDLPERFNTVEIKIDGETISAPVITHLTIEEIGLDMDVVAAQMGYWGNVLAAAEEEVEAAQAAYRSWRANIGMAILEENSKMAEWKVKQEAEASPQFLEHKSKIAKANRAANVCDKIFQAFAKKANVLQSRGANERTVLQKTGISTKGDPDTSGRNRTSDEERDARAQRVKDKMKRGKRKTKKTDEENED